MPLYEYECDACGHRFEKIQKFSDPQVEICPKCGGRVRKLIASPAFQFKGTGWYITDYAKKDGAGGGKSGGSEKEGDAAGKDAATKKDEGAKKDGAKSDAGSSSSASPSSTSSSSSGGESSSSAASKTSSKDKE